MFSAQPSLLWYKKTTKHKCQLLNFILGQSKMAVYVSRKRKVVDGVDADVALLFSRMVKARIMIAFKYYKEMLILCGVKEHQLTFSDQLT